MRRAMYRCQPRASSRAKSHIQNVARLSRFWAQAEADVGCRARRGIAAAFVAAVVSLTVATWAHAQSDLLKRLETCNGVGTASLDLQINGCTALIESGALAPQGLAVAFTIRGNGYVRKQDYDRAIGDYNDAIRLDANYSKAFNDRGVAYQKKVEFDRAIADFDQAIRLNPNYAIAFANRAQVYQTKGEFDRAVRDYGEVVRLQPQFEQVIRQQPALEADWKRTLEIVRNERCWVRAVTGDLQAALADCDEAIRLHPNTAAILDSRGFALLKMGRWDAAIADFDSALRLQPRLASSLYGRGFAKLKKGDARGGNADVGSATAIEAKIAETFARYGVK